MRASLGAVENFCDIAILSSHDHMPEFVVGGEESRHGYDVGEVSQGRRTKECARLIVEDLAKIVVGRYHHDMIEIVVGREECIGGHDAIKTGEVGLPFSLSRIEENLEDLPFGCANDGMAIVIIGGKEPTQRREDWVVKGFCHTFLLFALFAVSSRGAYLLRSKGSFSRRRKFLA
jgi:hypothetical protein